MRRPSTSFQASLLAALLIGSISAGACSPDANAVFSNDAPEVAGGSQATGGVTGASGGAGANAGSGGMSQRPVGGSPASGGTDEMGGTPSNGGEPGPSGSDASGSETIHKFGEHDHAE
jgi:hypothetical protein